MKTCADFAYTGVECCQGCHYEDEVLGRPMIIVRIDGEMARICCELADFFYPGGEWKDKDDNPDRTDGGGWGVGR